MAAQVMAGIAALQLAGGYFASQNIKETARLNQQIADMNAEFAELDAYDARIAGVTAQTKYQSIVDATTSEQKARLAAADVDVNFGSAAEIIEETEFIGELNQMEIQHQAEQKAMGYETEARQTRLGGEISRSRAESNASDVFFKSALGAGGTAAKAVPTDVTGYRRF